MLAFLLALVLASPGYISNRQNSSAPALIVVEDATARGLRENLMDRLMDKFHSMNDAGQGFFQDDISPMLAPYFPPGQPIAETVKVIHDQKLGELRKFKGMQDPGTTAYVSKFNLMSGMYSEVYVVLNFEFEGSSEANMVVKKATAYIRGSNM